MLNRARNRDRGPSVPGREAGEMGSRHSLRRAGALEGRGRSPGHPFGREDAGRGRAAPDIFVRCKIAARGSSDWHGLILGGRALDCASRVGLGFRPGPEHHILDTQLSIRIPRCEDYTRVRKDRAHAVEARLSSLDGAGCFEPGGADRELLRYSGPLELAPGDGVLVPVEREVQSSADISLTEAVFPVVDCGVEAVPGLWTTGAARGSFSSRLRRSLRSGQVWWRPRPATVARSKLASSR